MSQGQIDNEIEVNTMNFVQMHNGVVQCEELKTSAELLLATYAAHFTIHGHKGNLGYKAGELCRMHRISSPTHAKARKSLEEKGFITIKRGVYGKHYITATSKLLGLVDDS
tara:strand:+ start:456 stop:788 length:333 start_codon:yes stop_codon:yes gene_type:complete